MKRFLSMVLVTLVWVPVLLAQMNVVSTSPADGAVNVPTNATVSFTFSEPIDTTRIGQGQGIPFVFTIASPTDSIHLDSLYYSTDFTTVYFDFQLTPNTDYVFILTYAKSTNGNVLEHPYALNFTTASDHGQYTISGNIQSDMGSVEDVIVIVSKVPVFGEEGGDIDNYVASGTVVTGGTNKLVSINDTLGYQAKYIRPGTYWLAAAKDVNGDGDIDPSMGDWIGMYDPDGDGREDSVVVSNQSVTNVDLTMFKFERGTVKQWVDSVRQIAQQFRDDSVRLVFIEAWEDSIVDGKDFGFFYVFATPGLDYFLGIYYGDFSVDIQDSVNWVPVDTTAPEIPANFIDSDSASAIAEANGGAAFRQRYPNWYLNYFVGNVKSYLYQAGVNDTTKVVWVFHYRGYNENYDVFAEHVVVMDAETGTVYSSVTNIKDQDQIGVVPQAFDLKQNYPNPFNPSTVIEYTVPKAMDVKLIVYDALGRRVATLVNGRVPAGTHRVQFNAERLSAGVYFYTLKAGEYIKTRKMLLMK